MQERIQMNFVRMASMISQGEENKWNVLKMAIFTTEEDISNTLKMGGNIKNAKELQ